MKKRLSIDGTFFLVTNRGEWFSGGEVYHEVRNTLGGSIATPIARTFVTIPAIGAEGSHPHTRVDCVVREHVLAPDPAVLAVALVTMLKSQGLIAEPIWLAWWQAKELGGEAQGEVFEFD